MMLILLRVCLCLVIDAPRRLADDKQSGALELLLCTSLAAEEIVRGNTIRNTTPESSGYGIAVCDVSGVENPQRLTYQIYGNTIENTYGNGIFIGTLTEKPFYIYNNTITNAGDNGIKLSISPDLKLIGEVYNNTITNPTNEHIKVLSGIIDELIIHDNIEN